jgi:2-amino-4,5-dihydroxy-6-oxo-7-(phosphooxy)heptanoate synthase
MRQNSGRALRLKRLYKHDPERLFIVPMDHSVTDGPFNGHVQYEGILETLATSRVDAVVLHKGRMRDLSPSVYRALSIIVHVSASTKYASDANDKYIVGRVDDAVRRGADGISVHVNLGSSSEAQQLRDLSEVADACDQAGVPLLAMMYLRGEYIQSCPKVATLAHAASLAGDLGADLVKLSLPNNVDEIAWITSMSPLPVVAAGGSVMERDTFMRFVRNVLQGGGAGLAAGRNVFLSPDVGDFAQETRRCFDRTPRLTSSTELVHLTPPEAAPEGLRVKSA